MPLSVITKAVRLVKLHSTVLTGIAIVGFEVLHKKLFCREELITKFTLIVLAEVIFPNVSRKAAFQGEFFSTYTTSNIKS